MLEGIGLFIVHELLDNRVPDKRTSKLTGNDANVAHIAGRVTNLNRDVRVNPGLD